MGRLTVSVEQDHLERLIRRPAAGLAELVWNAFDADADQVTIELTLNALDGVESVIVSDNGTGITPERVQQSFSHLGGSWKKSAGVTDGGRRLHGQAGQGRWAAYGLGEAIKWMSVADRITGVRQRLEILGRRTALRDFEVNELEVVEESVSPGTVVEVSNLTKSAQDFLSRDDVAEELASIFALYLQQYPVALTWRRERVDPSVLQSRKHESDLDIDEVGRVGLVIIEWKRQTRRALHLCDSSGASLHELPPGVQAPGFEFTAYLKWDGFRDMQTDLVLAEFGQEPLQSIVDAGKAEIRRYFKERASEKGVELVKAWKADNTYPYRDEPVTTVAKAERELFDIVAVTAAPIVETVDVKARRLSLRLLREAIEKSPRTVHKVLQEVLDLPADRLEELRELVERTSLSAVITAARQITDRLDFLTGLEQIVFDRDLRKHVLERSQLHRILANETWVFREEYALTADDVTLRTALRQYIEILGRSDLAPEEVEGEEVLDENGRRVVVDMMLSRVVEQRRNQREHIVIELKRPTVHVGMEQLGQINNYADAVAADSRFAKIDTRWEFWIVGDQLDASVERMANQSDREAGIVVLGDGGRFVVRAVTWAQVIQDARHRLSFVKNALEYASSVDSGMDYLRRAHGKYLPLMAQEGPQTGSST